MRGADVAESGLNHVATFVEIFKDEHNKYPSSLEELESGLIGNEFLSNALHDSFNHNYKYSLMTNSFIIGVTNRNSIWHEKYGISKTFKFGEALK